MVPARRPSAYLVSLLASPILVLGLVGWTRLESSRAPGEMEPGPELGAASLAVLAIERLWTAYDVEQGADTGTLDGFRVWLDARGVTAGQPVEIEHDGPLEAEGDAIVVQRTDHVAGVELAFARADPGMPSESLGAWEVTPQVWTGTGYALLGRDLGCALCHVTVRPAPRDALGSGGSTPADEAVRIGVLGDLVLRSDARIDVHGTLHVAGALLGADDEALAPQRCAQLRFAALDGDLALEVVQPLDIAPLEAMDLVRLRAFEGQLLGRQRGAPRVVREALPRRFPGFDGVRPADDAGAPCGPARTMTRGLGGGRGGVVQRGARLGDLDAGAPLAPASRVAGHLWAVGTATEPLRLDGDVEVDGDLVIGGVVHGRGTLRARGSVVVVGSLRVAGELALVAGTDLLAGALVDAGDVAKFVHAARRTPLELPCWITAERLGRMGDRGEGQLVLEAFCYAPRHVIVVARRGAARGDVRVRGGLVAEVVAVHAPGELLLEDDPDARALLALRAPQGLVLGEIEPRGVAGGSREAAPRPIDFSGTDSPSDRPHPNPR